jgi:hypothetical protein
VQKGTARGKCAYGECLLSCSSLFEAVVSRKGIEKKREKTKEKNRKEEKIGEVVREERRGVELKAKNRGGESCRTRFTLGES